MAVFQELAPGDTLLVGGHTRIRLEHKSGSRARLRIESDQDIDRVKAGEPLPPTTATPTAAPGAPRARLRRS